MVNTIFSGISYNSLQFILFLIIFLSVYFVVPKNWMKIGIIICGNVFFYRYAAGFNQLCIVIATFATVYVFSLLLSRIYAAGELKKPAGMTLKQEIEYWKPYRKKARTVLIIGIIIIISVLAYVKIGKLFKWDNVNLITQVGLGKYLVPLGLSYYTFSAIGYLADIYKRKIKCTYNGIVLFACMTYFPIIVEGPISRYDRLTEQFLNIPKFNYSRFCRGMQRMLWGLFKKLVIADRMSPFVTEIFTYVEGYAGVEILFALIFTIIVTYADFSGCMDVVIGVSESMGIKLDENFRQPFFSKNIMELWRRWHITLLSWLRDYIYMPIAQSSFIRGLTRKVKKRFGKHIAQTIVSIIPTGIVLFFVSLWHGTGMDYMLWGGVLDRIFVF